MTYNNTDIYMALHILKTVCADNYDCRNCPMHTEKGCLLKQQAMCPEEWKLNEVPEMWQAVTLQKIRELFAPVFL